MVPTLWPSSGWEVTTRSGAAVRALRSRHYSTFGSTGRTVGPPGRVLILRTADGLAGWITHWPARALALDGLDAWRCSLFRNEGPRLSSELVLEAEALTRATWGESDEWGEPAPRDGWITWIDTRKVASPNPGFCFKVAGWEVDRTWSHPHLIRLRKAAA